MLSLNTNTKIYGYVNNCPTNNILLTNYCINNNNEYNPYTQSVIHSLKSVIQYIQHSKYTLMYNQLNLDKRTPRAPGVTHIAILKHVS